MDKLLPNSITRRLKLLELLNSSGQWVPVDYISKELKCTSQTVLSDCEHLENEWPDYLSFDFSKQRGVRLQTVKNHPISDLYKEIMKATLMFSLMEVVFFNPGRDSAFYSQQLFISESSLYRTFRLLKPVLKKREIQFSQTSYRMTSENELQIRYFLIAYFLEINKISDWPFPIEKEKLLKAVKIIRKNFPFGMSTSFTAYFLYSTAITIIREQQGFKVKPAILNQKLSTSPIKVLEELDLFLEENFPDVEINSFYLSTFWWEYTWDNPQEKINIQTVAEQFVDLLSTSLNIKASSENKRAVSEWMTHVYSRHKFYPYEKFILYDTYRYSTASIKSNYVFYTRAVAECLEKIEKKTRFPWKTKYLNEILHKTLILWTDLLESIDNSCPQLSIVIISNIGVEHAKILSYLINKRFREKVTISFSEKDSSLIEIDHYDLCVSNYTVDFIDEKNLIVVDDIPSNKNWIDLSSIINSKRNI